MVEKMESMPEQIDESANAEIAETASDGSTASDLESNVSDTKEDFWNPDTWGKTPEEVGKKAFDVIKKIQTKYNEKATKAKTLEKDYTLAQRELEQVVTDVKRALSDKNYYEEQRKKLGYIDNTPDKTPEIDFSKMETVGDVVNAFQNMKNYFEGRISDIQRQTELRSESKINEAVAPISRERWSLAMDNMENKYGDAWSKVQHKVVNSILSGNYVYKPGSEKEVLEKVFRAECPNEYESVVIQNLKKRAEEKKVLTKEPNRTAPKIKPGNSGNLATDIIARVNARLSK